MAFDPAILHTNQRLLVQELLRRGASVAPLKSCDETFVVSFGGRSEILWDRFSCAAPYSGARASADKHMAKEILSLAGVPVPEGILVHPGHCQDACEAAGHLGFPLVIKPNWGSHGDGVVCGISSREALAEALSGHFSSTFGQDPAIVERHVPGEEHRVIAFSSGAFAAVRRERAHVVGDGVSDIATLASVESARRVEAKRSAPSSLCPVALDEEAVRHLKSLGFARGLSHVPARGEKIHLRGQSNLAKGGVAVDITDSVHPGIVELAMLAMRALCLPVAGVDILCQDPSLPPASQDLAVVEVNSNPGLAMHAYPGEGKPRPVAFHLADSMFPWIPANRKIDF